MKNLYLVCVIFLSFLFCSYGDEIEGRITFNDTAPATVANLVTTGSGPREVYLSWKIPIDPSFMYTKVEYISSKREQERKYKYLI